LKNDFERKTRSDNCLNYAKLNYNQHEYIAKLLVLYKQIIDKHKLSKESQYLLNQLNKHNNYDNHEYEQDTVSVEHEFFL